MALETSLRVAPCRVAAVWREWGAPGSGKKKPGHGGSGAVLRSHLHDDRQRIQTAEDRELSVPDENPPIAMVGGEQRGMGWKPEACHFPRR